MIAKTKLIYLQIWSFHNIMKDCFHSRQEFPWKALIDSLHFMTRKAYRCFFLSRDVKSLFCSKMAKFPSKFPEVGCPQLSSADSKFADNICFLFAELATNAAICGFAICGPYNFRDLRSQLFFCSLKTPQIRRYIIYKAKMLSFKFKDDFQLLERFHGIS